MRLLIIVALLVVGAILSISMFKVQRTCITTGGGSGAKHTTCTTKIVRK